VVTPSPLPPGQSSVALPPTQIRRRISENVKSVFFLRDFALQAKGASVREGHGPRTYAIKPIELLVPVGFMRYRTSTSGLSTWWSSTALKRDLVLRGASRLDAFSGYPVRT
jgi:hypothetical protein